MGVSRLLLSQQVGGGIVGQLHLAGGQGVEEGPGAAPFAGEEGGFVLALLVQEVDGSVIHRNVLGDETGPARFAAGRSSNRFKNVHCLLVALQGLVIATLNVIHKPDVGQGDPFPIPVALLPADSHGGLIARQRFLIAPLILIHPPHVVEGRSFPIPVAHFTSDN